MVVGYWKKVRAMKKDWKSISAEDKSKYFRLAKADRDRYIKATAGERRKYERHDGHPERIADM